MLVPPLYGTQPWPDECAVRPRRDVVFARRNRLTVVVPEPLRSGVEASARLAGTTPERWVAAALTRSLDPRLGA